MIYRFAQFELDLAKFELRANGAVRPLEPQVFALMALLVGNRERVITRDEIIEKVWDGRVVSDAAIDSRIKSARRALGDDGNTQRFIRTLHRQGFRFVADAVVAPEVFAHSEKGEAEAATPSEDARPSIAVLPFRLLGMSEAYGAMADALPHELIADLARLRWLFVTARESSFRLRGGEAAAEIGRLLGVRYYLSGTVEMADRR